MHFVNVVVKWGEIFSKCFFMEIILNPKNFSHSESFSGNSSHPYFLDYKWKDWEWGWPGHTWQQHPAPQRHEIWRGLQVGGKDRAVEEDDHGEVGAACGQGFLFPLCWWDPSYSKENMGIGAYDAEERADS